jgi:hypothetical protein
MKQLFFIILSVVLMLMSTYALFTSTGSNEATAAIVAFILSCGLGLVAVLDYDYQTKHNRL